LFKDFFWLFGKARDHELVDLMSVLVEFEEFFREMEIK
jgi:hypothetical protein